ncbi:DUF2332 domain-containing protein [Alteraurantiacibacter palmitatis]|uniref:DUF2332 domain-containing protein n=1 Tax=Alteraurantiacibacter palmitatis TaxID=2054628 RepID=A0ABV7E479_9SPHN
MFMSSLAVPIADHVAKPGRAEQQLLIEAEKARSFGKLMVASVFESAARVLPDAPLMRDRMDEWPGDMAGAGVIFRLNAGLHALARSGRDPALQRIYRAAAHGDLPAAQMLDLALRDALNNRAQDLLEWMAGPTQTNEVARVAGLAGVLMELNARAAMPVELLELGASAGLNLNLSRYHCQMGAAHCGPDASPVQIAPRWIGRAVPQVPFAIARSIGVDPNPLDIGNAQDCERLHAYIWPGEKERSARLAAALELARRLPPRVDRGTASEWLPRQLARVQPPQMRRVVFHSMVVQYMSTQEREMVDAALSEAGQRAAPDRPLVRVGLEWTTDRTQVELHVTQWTGGDPESRVVARCHPYGEWFDWAGLG